MNTKKLVRVLPIALAIGLFASCDKKQAEVQVEDKAVKVKTAVATSRMVDETTTYTANIQSDVKNQIVPATGGRIRQIYVEVGQRVSKGQALVQMEDHNLQQQEVQLESLKKDYNRFNELLQVGGIAQQQVDQIKTQIDVLEASIASTKINTVLKSPINGVVTARNYDNGDVYGQNPILIIEQLNPLKAVVNVSESYFPQVKVGMPVDVQVDIYGNEVFNGKVSLITPVIDAATHTFAVEVSVDNRENKIAPGMYSRVTMNFGSNEQVIIPDIAVTKQSGSNDRFVYIVDGNKVRYSKVQIGKRIEENVVILSGVAAGEEVVTAGQTRLIDGKEIEIINE